MLFCYRPSHIYVMSISAQGLHAEDSKVKAVLDAPEPGCSKTQISFGDGKLILKVFT